MIAVLELELEIWNVVNSLHVIIHNFYGPLEL